MILIRDLNKIRASDALSRISFSSLVTLVAEGGHCKSIYKCPKVEHRLLHHISAGLFHSRVVMSIHTKGADFKLTWRWVEFSNWNQISHTLLYLEIKVPPTFLFVTSSFLSKLIQIYIIYVTICYIMMTEISAQNSTQSCKFQRKTDKLDVRNILYCHYAIDKWIAPTVIIDSFNEQGI